VKGFLIALAILSLLANLYFANALWFRTPSTTTAQSSGMPVVMRTPGGLLEVSNVRIVERFEAATDHTILGVPVGRTIAMIQVPAVYRYHIELAPEWRMRLDDKTLIVVAPPVKPSLPVAIDTARLEGFSAGAWSLVTGDRLLRQLQMSITARLDAKASSAELVGFQRETARKTVTEFVDKWVLDQPRWKSSPKPAARVFFADEPIEQLRSLPPPYF
jgi:hypothetical protein